MSKWFFSLMLGGLAAAFLAGCLFDSLEEAPKLTLRFTVKHTVDSHDLVLNTSDHPYTNAAGNQYKVEELKYILSDIKLHDADGSIMVHIDKALYFNAAVESTLVKEFEVLEPKHYHSMSFVFGLVPEKNATGEHDLTHDLQRMGWPDGMGGGYHFMQMNGKYLDDSLKDASVLTHLGRSVTDTLTGDPHFAVEKIQLHQTLGDGDELNVTVSMNLNQWFQDPNLYDFKDHGEIMDKPGTQLLLRENGMNGVFSGDTVYLEGALKNDGQNDL